MDYSKRFLFKKFISFCGIFFLTNLFINNAKEGKIVFFKKRFSKIWVINSHDTE